MFCFCFVLLLLLLKLLWWRNNNNNKKNVWLDKFWGSVLYYIICSLPCSCSCCCVQAKKYNKREIFLFVFVCVYMCMCVLGSHLLSLSSLLRFRFRFLNPKDDDDDEKEIISIVGIIWKILLYSLYLNQTLFSLKHIKSNYSLSRIRLDSIHMFPFRYEYFIWRYLNDD